MENAPTLNRVENYLSFDLTPQHQALLSTLALVEIIHLNASEIVPIPEMPSAVAGVCSWQGEVLWLVDLSYWSGATPLLTSADGLSAPSAATDQGFQATYASTGSYCNILKVRCQGGILGLLVHQVGQLQSCDVQQIQSTKHNSAPSGLNTVEQGSLSKVRQECIKGIWTSPSGEQLPILDLDTVVQHLVQ
ncbi:MAG: chemotaxis protein CheW [Microcoleaceae cyanobacterium]